ncbi:MAG TPA: hypothetical protein ENJ32_07855 [Crenotrichaceae bacterium]|nr:hypothetical protein [Crenotrichaceae bacterium]
MNAESSSVNNYPANKVKVNAGFFQQPLDLVSGYRVCKEQILSILIQGCRKFGSAHIVCFQAMVGTSKKAVTYSHRQKTTLHPARLDIEIRALPPLVLF